jgi:hypothetical protein
MITYEWKINSLSVVNAPEENTAVMSNFTIVGKDGSVTGSVTYSVNLLPADANNFTPFSDITEEMAIQWTKDALGQDRVTAMQAEVQSQIDARQVPTPQVAPLPWAPVEESISPEDTPQN